MSIKFYSAQYFVTFWRNIDSKLMVKYMCHFLLYCPLCLEMNSYSADFAAAFLA